jgi:hypothetical protein
MNPFVLACQPSPPTPPPAGFNLNLTRLAEFDPRYAQGLHARVTDGSIDGYMQRGEMWVSVREVHDLLPAGHDTVDPDSDYYIPAGLISDG